MGTVSENRGNFMTKKTPKVIKKKATVIQENIYSIYNQEFRYPTIVTRLLNWMNKVVS